MPTSPSHRHRRDQTGKTLPHTTLATEEDPIDPPDRPPFSETLSTELLDVVRNHWSTIRTRVSRGPLQCRYDYRLTTLDTTVLEPPLKIMFQEQTNAFKINVRETDVLQRAINQRPDFAWVCELVTNVTFFVNRIIDHPIGCVRANPFQSTSRSKKASSVWKRNPTITRGTMITCFSSCVCPCIEDAIYIDWDQR